MTNKIFFDTEFIEGKQPKKVLGITYGHTKPTIDLISIGMVNERGQEYYAISKDFNLDLAWNNEWVRKNVLLPIYKDTYSEATRHYAPSFSKSGMKGLIKHHGKSNELIAREINHFSKNVRNADPEFYAYFADYDWVVMCQLFGTMMDLPNRFPMYCKDLKQMLDGLSSKLARDNGMTPEAMLTEIQSWGKYPKNNNEHNALDDAKWNLELYNFIKNHK